MTSELEKQFFDTFGIEPREQEVFVLKRMIVREYPQITDRILLELICVLNDFTGIDVRATKIEELKEELLNHCIDLITYELNNIDDITNVKHQVRTLFEE